MPSLPLLKSLNYYAGKALYALGYKVVRSYRIPQCTLNILELGISSLRRRGKELTVVQVGAFDGVRHDPLQSILLSGNIRAVLVEPQKEPFLALLKRYQGIQEISIENCAISNVDGEIDMYLPACAESSLRASLNPLHGANFGLRKQEIRRITVNSLTVKTLVARYRLQTVDLLQIDAEGHDYKILGDFFDAGIEPYIINLEILHLNKKELTDIRQELETRNYKFIEYGIDLLAKKQQHATSSRSRANANAPTRKPIKDHQDRA